MYNIPVGSFVFELKAKILSIIDRRTYRRMYKVNYKNSSAFKNNMPAVS